MTRQRLSSPSALTCRQFGKQAVTAGLAAVLAGTPVAGQANASADRENETDGEIEARGLLRVGRLTNVLHTEWHLRRPPLQSAPA